MTAVAGLTKNAILFIVSLYLVISFSNSQITNEQYSSDSVKDRLDALEAKVADLTVQLEQEKILRGHLEAKLEAVLLPSDNKAAKLDACQVERKTSVSTGKVTSGRISGEMPSNCGEVPLVTIGYDGLYLIFNKVMNKVQIVYCQFPAVNKYEESLIGNLTIEKTTNTVHFYVQRDQNSNAISGVLTFDSARLNIGDAMNLNGVFTAPVSGVYTFHFSALKDGLANEVWIFLRVNGNDNVAFSYANGQTEQIALSPISASLKLTKGDEVTLFKEMGGISDNGPGGKFTTHFTGWLVEEDLLPFLP